ncbi:hypothetical protein [Pedobacter sp.]|uniref:hypothetical protein n=1 Tax=Pedobacter sp. TaxID=1411316 RepID=UPI0031E1AD80
MDIVKKNKGEQLIAALEANPEKFFKYGKSYDLLQEYFAGLSLDTLVSLLQSENLAIQKSVIWIVSELATNSCALLPYVIPLTKSKDNYIKYYALECILLCATGKYIKEFIHLIKSIDNDEGNIKVLAMNLLTNAGDAQLQAGIELVTAAKLKGYELHKFGLTNLLNHLSLNQNEILDMLNSNEPLTQQYGAMLAKRKQKDFPKLIAYALTSKNPEVKGFAEFVIDIE